jgi:hypothetical protein
MICQDCRASGVVAGMRDPDCRDFVVKPILLVVISHFIFSFINRNKLQTAKVSYSNSVKGFGLVFDEFMIYYVKNSWLGYPITLEYYPRRDIWYCI